MRKEVADALAELERQKEAAEERPGPAAASEILAAMIAEAIRQGFDGEGLGPGRILAAAQREADRPGNALRREVDEACRDGRRVVSTLGFAVCCRVVGDPDKAAGGGFPVAAISRTEISEPSHAQEARLLLELMGQAAGFVAKNGLLPVDEALGVLADHARRAATGEGGSA
jgi:hypothetical protein